MNICVLIAGMWFLKLDDGYDGSKYVNVENIVAISNNNGIGSAYIRSEINFDSSVWDIKNKRWLDSTELAAIMETCK